MRQLGLILIAVGTFAAVACQTSEPARTNPPSSGAAVPAVAPNAAPPAGGSAPVYDEAAQVIDAHPNDHFAVALKANVTTPFEWRLDPAPNPAVVSLSGHEYTDAPPPGCSTCVGYGGTDSFSFVATGAGETDLHFQYARVSKGDSPPARTLNVHVRVH